MIRGAKETTAPVDLCFRVIMVRNWILILTIVLWLCGGSRSDGRFHISSVCFPISSAGRSHFLLLKTGMNKESSVAQEWAENKEVLLQLKDTSSKLEKALGQGIVISKNRSRRSPSSLPRSFWKKKLRETKRSSDASQGGFPNHINPIFEGYNFLERSGKLVSG